MHIVFYSTNSNHFDITSFHYTNLPQCAQQFEQLAIRHPGDRFTVVTQFPGLFLLDMDNTGISTRAASVNYVLTTKNPAKDIAAQIAELAPDIAVAVTFWIAPFDWLGIQDALIAEKLKERHIKTICNSADTAMLCFDKWRTHEFLARCSFTVPRAVHVHHELFRIERFHKEVRVNNYQEYVLQRISELQYPVVIKDTLGLSSYGTVVATTFAQAKALLLSKRNSGDRIVEEYISGIQAGAEVYGSNGNYTVFGPFFFSVNKYGITSPKQSVKLGPVTRLTYNIEQLHNDMRRIAHELNISGCAQFDLVFDGSTWYIIEINPRLSGMSRCTAAAYGTTALELLYSAIPEESNATFSKSSASFTNTLVMDIKFPLLSSEEQERLYHFPSVQYVGQTVNDNATQIREHGYCEVIFGGKKTPGELRGDLEQLKAAFPASMEPVFYDNACSLLALL